MLLTDAKIIVPVLQPSKLPLGVNLDCNEPLVLIIDFAVNTHDNFAHTKSASLQCVESVHL